MWPCLVENGVIPFFCCLSQPAYYDTAPVHPRSRSSEAVRHRGVAYPAALAYSRNGPEPVVSRRPPPSRPRHPRRFAPQDDWSVSDDFASEISVDEEPRYDVDVYERRSRGAARARPNVWR